MPDTISSASVNVRIVRAERKDLGVSISFARKTKFNEYGKHEKGVDCSQLVCKLFFRKIFNNYTFTKTDFDRRTNNNSQKPCYN
jgi:hypothetical protein